MIDATFRTLLCAGAATLAFGCSADAASPDAARGGNIDARVTPRVDARRFELPDAGPNFDAMPGCVDSSEPNDTSAAAFSLAAEPVDDNDVIETFIGTAMGADEDWYTYEGSDGGATGVVDPTVDVVTGAISICMYLDCLVPPTSFTCPANTTDDTNGDLVGCCASTGFSISGVIDGLSCNGAEDADVYIRIRASGAGVCEAYSVNWHY